MSESYYACMFMTIFFGFCGLYGLLVKMTGNKDLLPYRAQLSVSDEDDVRRVGHVTIIVSVIGMGAFLVAMIAARHLGG